MKIVDWGRRDNEFYISFLKFRVISVIQTSFALDDGDPNFYYFQLCSGNGYLIDVLICLGKVSLSFSLLGRGWPLS